MPVLAVGVVGVGSVASNLYSAEVQRLVSAFREGNLTEAQAIHRRFLPLFKDLFSEPNPVAAKTALGWRGAMSSECRLPLVKMGTATEARLRQTIEALEQKR